MGLAVRTSYTMSVRARNDAGWGEWSEEQAITTTATVPTVPLMLKSSDITDISFTFAWTAPEVSQTKISKYEIKKDGELYTSSSCTLATIMGLAVDTSYALSVRALNDAGWSDWSEEFVTKTTATPPTPPMELKSTDVTDISFTLLWSQPKVSQTAISLYEIQKDGKLYTTSTCPVATFVDLAVATEYTMKIRAQNDAGWSEWSTAFRVTTTATPPTAPLELKPANITDITFTLNWTAPEVTQTPIHEYEIRRNGELYTTSSCDRATVMGLAVRTSYTMSVRARNDAGWGEWSEDKAIKTTATDPTVPLALEPSEITDTSFVLSWTAPKVSQTPIHEYEINMDGELYSVSSVEKATINGLGVGRCYTMSVRARNDAGWSKWSADEAVRTTATPPSVPFELSGDDVTDTTFTLLWKPPADSQTPVNEYEICKNGEFYATSACNNTPVRGTSWNALNANTAYTMKVRAKNNAGWGEWSADFDVTTTGTALATLRTAIYATPLTCLILSQQPHRRHHPPQRARMLQTRPSSSRGMRRSRARRP
jgi:hypothetical protein